MVDHELDELRREFLDEAREKVGEMESFLGDTKRETLDRLAYLAHQLKGSGGSYGYQRISTDAAELEKAVESIGEDGDGSSLAAKLHEHVGNLKNEIERRAKELA